MCPHISLWTPDVFYRRILTSSAVQVTWDLFHQYRGCARVGPTLLSGNINVNGVNCYAYVTPNHAGVMKYKQTALCNSGSYDRVYFLSW